MKIVRYLNEKIEEIPLILMFITMTIVMGIQIFCRYCLNNSLSWSEELTRYMFIWSGFLSVSYCIKHHNEIRIEMLVDLLPPRLWLLLRIFVNLLMIIFFYYMCKGSWSFLQSALKTQQVSPAMGIPMYYIQSAPFICSILAFLRTLQIVFQEVIKLINRDFSKIKD